MMITSNRYKQCDYGLIFNSIFARTPLMRNGPNLSPVHIWQVTQADVGKPSQTHQWFTLSALCNALALLSSILTSTPWLILLGD